MEDRLNAEQVREILKKAMPPDDGPAAALGGLMLEFVDRLTVAEDRLEKLGRFTVKKVGDLDARIPKAEEAAPPADPSAQEATPEPEEEAPAGPEGIVPPGAYGAPPGAPPSPVEPPPNGSK